MSKHTFPRWLATLLGLAVVILLVSGVAFYRTQEQEQRHHAEAELLAVAQLKVDQIAGWRAERLADAAVLMESPFFVEGVVRWLASSDAQDAQPILRRFHALAKYDHYSDVLLMDAGGQVRLSLSGYPGPLDADALRTLAAAWRARRPLLTDLHDGPANHPPQLDVIVPLMAVSAAAEPVGAVVLQADARQFLYPLIQSWPTPSRSAETLLVQRDGDDVLFLNDLRHQKAAALNLRIPLSRADVPAVQAALGREGVLQGRDYRGVEVLSALKAVPDSPWFLVAKVDTKEIFAASRLVSAFILTLLLLLTAGAVTVVALVWQRNEKARYRDLVQAEAALRASEERYRRLFESAKDGILILAAETGIIIDVNPYLADLLGFSREQVLGQTLWELGFFRDVAANQAKFAELCQKKYVRYENLPLETTAGRRLEVEFVSNLYEMGHQSVIQCNIRDITERKRTQEALRRERDRAQSYLDTVETIIVALNTHGEITTINRKGGQLFGCGENELIGQFWFSTCLPQPDGMETVYPAFLKLVAGEVKLLEYQENPIVTRTGELRQIAWHNAVLRDEQGRIIGTLSSGEDITERQRAEKEREALIELLRLINANDDVHTLMRAATGFLQNATDCEAVGVRLREGEDFPYFQTRGFPAEFVHIENRLCAVDERGELVRDCAGNSALECMCGNILCGRFDPSKPFFTARGSFWTNSTTELLATTTEADRQSPTRNYCNTAGYESLALLPLRVGDTTFGLLQFNDRRRGRFTPEKIALMERFADHLSIGLAHRQAEVALQQSAERHSRLVENIAEAVLIDDCDGRIVYANDRFLETFGIARDELAALWLEDYVAPKWRARLRQIHDQRVRGSDVPVRFEYEGLRKNGSTVWLEVSVTPVTQNGRIVGTQSLIHDITERKQAEETLRLNELRLNEAQAIGHVGSFSYDFVTDTVWWSDETYRLFGVDPSTGPPRLADVERMIHPDDLERWHSYTPRALAAGASVVMENRIVRPDGTIRHHSVVSCVRVSLEGQPLEIAGTIQDVTERKLAEWGLRQSEERYRTLVANIPEVVFRCEVSLPWRVHYCSEAVLALTGYPASDFVHGGRTYPSLVHPDDLPALERAVAEAVAERRPFNIEHRLQDAADRTRWVLVRAQAQYDVNGAPRWLDGIIHDVSERRLADEERTRLSAAIEQAAEVIVITDPTGAIQYVNPAFERVTGYAREEALGKNPRVLKSGVQDGAFYAAMWQTISSGASWEGRMVNKRKDGTLFTEEATISPVRDPAGSIVNYVAVKRDITHELEVEEQLRQSQKMEEVGRLAGGVAHDLNNTLTAIFGYLDLARSQLPTGHAAGASLDGLENAAKQAAGVTRGLLAFSGRTSPTKQNLALGKLLAETIRMLRHMLPASIAIEADVPPDAGLTVYADPTQIQQVLVNLTINARDAMPEGGQLGILLSEVQDTSDAEHLTPTRMARIAVRDTGAGMPPEVCARIFEPFFTTKARGQGTGLGLAIVHGIVRDHGGRIEVHSEPGRGTTMTILLPTVAAEAADVAAAAPDAIQPGRRSVVLLAEDQEHVRRVLATTLEATGYEIVEAVDGEELQQRFSEAVGRLRLLIFDIDLPKRSGLACLQAIRAAGCQTPAILITGKVETDLEAGLDGHTTLLRKPFRVTELAKLAGRMLTPARPAEVRE